jgi:hypothetical protein
LLRTGKNASRRLTRLRKAANSGKTEKYRQRETHQAEIEKEAQLQAEIENSKTLSILIKQVVLIDDVPTIQFVKHSNSRLSEFSPKAQTRHFHAWVKTLTGFPKDFQQFSKFDDNESVTFRSFSDPRSPNFQKILGETFRFLFPKKKRPKITRWRDRRRWPATIPLKANYSRLLRRHDISVHGLCYQKPKEALELRLRPCVVGMCSPRVHRAENQSKTEFQKLQLNTEFIAHAQWLMKPEQLPETPDWRALIGPLPTSDPDKFSIQVDLRGHFKSWEVGRDKAREQITSRSGLEPKTTMVLLNDEEWTGDRPAHPGDKVAFRTITVTPPLAVPEELSGKPESSSFQVHVKADEKAGTCTLHPGREFEDLSEFIHAKLGWQDFAATFDGHP